MRHVDEEAPRERNLRGHARPLGRNGLLGHLNDERVTLLDDILNGNHPVAPRTGGRIVGVVAPVFLAIVLVTVGVAVVIAADNDVGGVQEGALLGTNIDEGGLNPWLYRLDASQVDVSNHPTCFRTVDQEFNELVVLDDGDADFPRRRTDEYLSFHRRPSIASRYATRRAGGDGYAKGWV